MGCDFYVMKDGIVKVVIKNQDTIKLLDTEFEVKKGDKIYYSIYSGDSEVLRER